MSKFQLFPEMCPELTQLELEVCLCDTDPYGIVNNAEYFNYFESARLDFLKKCGIDIQKNIGALPFELHSWNCKYINSLYVFDTMLIKTRMRMDTVQLIYSFTQVMYHKQSNRLLAKSSTIMKESE